MKNENADLKKRLEGKIAAGLSHIAVRTSDIEKSVRFYTEVLGMEEAFRLHRDDGSLTTVYLIIAPGQYLELFTGGKQKTEILPDSIGMCHICLMTEDIDRSYQAVAAKGGPIDREIRRGYSRCIMFWTHDPDGTPIEIMQMPPESMQAQADRRFLGTGE